MEESTGRNKGDQLSPKEAKEASHALFAILTGFSKSMALKALCLLTVPDILAEAGGRGSFLSAAEIAARLPGGPAANVEYLARVLNASVQFGILAGKREASSSNSAEGAAAKRLYGLNALSTFLVRDNNPKSMAPHVLLQMHRVAQAPWMHFHEAVVTGKLPFVIAHDKNIWAYTRDDPEWSNVLNDAMASYTSLVVDTLVTKYEGFKGVKILVDVGGGTGRFLQEVVAKFPEIRGINFDLPHVVAQAPHVEGVEQVGGSMFESVPKGDLIFTKFIIHDWDDERCIQILKNCIKALPEHGKVVISDIVMPDDDVASPYGTIAAAMDLTMLAHSDGGKERTKEQWKALVRAAGFARCEFVKLESESGFDQWLIEAYKH